MEPWSQFLRDKCNQWREDAGGHRGQRQGQGQGGQGLLGGNSATALSCRSSPINVQSWVHIYLAYCLLLRAGFVVGYNENERIWSWSGGELSNVQWIIIMTGTHRPPAHHRYHQACKRCLIQPFSGFHTFLKSRYLTAKHSLKGSLVINDSYKCHSEKIFADEHTNLNTLLKKNSNIAYMSALDNDVGSTQLVAQPPVSIQHWYFHTELQ